MPGDAAHHVLVYTEKPPGRAPALLVGQVEDHARIEWHRHRRVVLDLAFELTRFPAGVAERDERVFGPFATRHRAEHITRGGHLNHVRDAMRAFPLAARPMQHEA